MKLPTGGIWAITFMLTVIVAGMVVLGALDKDTAILLSLTNLVATTANGIFTAIVNAKVDQVKALANGSNDRLLTMVAQTHPGIHDAAPPSRSDDHP